MNFQYKYIISNYEGGMEEGLRRGNMENEFKAFNRSLLISQKRYENLNFLFDFYVSLFQKKKKLRLKIQNFWDEL